MTRKSFKRLPMLLIIIIPDWNIAQCHLIARKRSKVRVVKSGRLANFLFLRTTGRQKNLALSFTANVRLWSWETQKSNLCKKKTQTYGYRQRKNRLRTHSTLSLCRPPKTVYLLKDSASSKFSRTYVVSHCHGENHTDQSTRTAHCYVEDVGWTRNGRPRVHWNHMFLRGVQVPCNENKFYRSFSFKEQ